MRIGVDLGGTKIEAVALDDDGRELARRRIATPRHDYEGTLAAIAGLVHEVEQAGAADTAGAAAAPRRTSPASVGVGIPGAMSHATGLVKNANSVWLIGRPLQQDLQERLNRPIRLANDANCFALSEAVDGAGAGARVVFGVIVGTGTGGGIVVDGQVLVGPNTIAGEWGHNALPWPAAGEWPGPPCYCGRSGCVETFLSGPGFERDHAQVTGTALAAAAIAEAARAGDPAALASLARYADRMARALAMVINILDPDVIVLGGGVSNVAALYALVPERWGRYVFSDRVDTRLVQARHGDSSGVRGAAWLWNDVSAGERR